MFKSNYKFQNYTTTGHSWVANYNNLKWANACLVVEVTALTFQYRSFGDLFISNINDSKLWSDSIINKYGNLPIPLITGRQFLENISDSDIVNLNNIYNSLVITSNIINNGNQNNTTNIILGACNEDSCSGNCVNSSLNTGAGNNKFSPGDISCQYLCSSQTDNKELITKLCKSCVFETDDNSIYYFVSPLNPFSIKETIGNIKYINNYITSNPAIYKLYTQFINTSYNIIAQEYENSNSSTGLGGYIITPNDKNNIKILADNDNSPDKIVNDKKKQSNAKINKTIINNDAIYGFGSATENSNLNTDYDINSGTIMRLWGEIIDFKISGNIDFNSPDKTINIRGYYLPTVVNYYYDHRDDIMNDNLDRFIVG